jgi:hypothetical protein
MAEPLSVAAPSLDALHTPERVWFELHREKDACDVLVQMDDGTVYTALFATMAYLQRQMDLQLQVTQQLEDTPAVRYYMVDTPHIMVDELERDVIEDTIDNLIALDVFESHFTRVTQNNGEEARTTSDGSRATQEITAVVISDVLVVEE